MAKIGHDHFSRAGFAGHSFDAMGFQLSRTRSVNPISGGYALRCATTGRLGRSLARDLFVNRQK
jgi:hypothetical protein